MFLSEEFTEIIVLLGYANAGTIAARIAVRCVARKEVEVASEEEGRSKRTGLVDQQVQ